MLSCTKLSYPNSTRAKASAVSPMLVCIVKFKNASRYSRSGISDVSCYQQARKHCTVSPMLVCIFRFKHTPRYLRRWFEWANGGVEKVAPHVPPRRFDGKMMFCNKNWTMFWCRTRRLDFLQEIGPSRRYATWRFVETVCYVCSKPLCFALLWAIFLIASRGKLLKKQWFF